MKNFIDSALIGSLATYLPFWIIDSTVQRIVLAIGLSIMVYAGKEDLSEAQGDCNETAEGR